MSWVKVETPSIPSVVTQDIPNIAKTVESTIDGILTLISSAIQALSLLDSFGFDSPLVLIIRASILELKGLINDLISGSVGVYYLNVPIVKTSGKPVVPIIPTQAISSATAVTNTINTLAPTTATIAGFESILGSGGNLGFYNTVYNSLRDPGDLDKPVFGSSDYVSGVAVLVGAPTFGAILNLVSLLRCAMGGSTVTGLDRNALAVPQHVKVTKVPAKKSTIRISWDPVPVTSAVVVFNSETNIKKIKIYSKPVSQGLLPYVAPIVDIEKFKVAEVEMFPSSVDLPEPTEDTYYALGFEYFIKDSDGTITKLDAIHLCQNALYQIGETSVPHYVTGIPPDWIQLSSSLDFFPVISSFLQETLDWISQIDATYSASVGGLALIAKTIQGIILQNKLILSRLLGILDNFFLPSFGAYALPFAGQGGNTQLLTSLSAGLFNSKTDTNRPPFDTGTELVAGFILMAGSHNQGDLSAINTVINFITGPTSPNLLKQQIDAISRIKDSLAGNTVVNHQTSPIAIGKKFQP